MTLEEWEQEEDRELDERLSGLFRAAERPAPSRRFVSSTMTAVRLASLPAGRQPLRRPWFVPAGWAALVTVAASVAFAFFHDEPIAAQLLSGFVGLYVRAAMWAVDAVSIASTVFDVLSTTSRVVSSVVSTREVLGALAAMSATGALSLSMLHKLALIDKESATW